MSGNSIVGNIIYKSFDYNSLLSDTLPLPKEVKEMWLYEENKVIELFGYFEWSYGSRMNVEMHELSNEELSNEELSTIEAYSAKILLKG